MSYIPKSEEQLAKEGLLSDGVYQFEVVETSNKPSKKGKAMFTLVLHVFGQDEDPHVIYDYITLGSNFGECKLRHAADACRLIPVYETGNLKSSDFQGKTGQVVIKQQEGTPEYPKPKNIVVDYIKRPTVDTIETGALAPEEIVKSVLADDGIPF